MKAFKDIMCQLSTTLVAAIFGNAIFRTFVGDYKTATILLYIVAVFFIVSYFAERFNK